MTKIYSLYGKDERTIDNLKRKIRGYEKMKIDITSQNRKLHKENKQLKEKLEASEKARKESILILGEYRHYTLPTEEQNRENEDIVDKAYNNLILKQDIDMNKIDYNSQQFKWAKEIMQEKNVTILDIDWNKFDTKEEIKEFIEMLEKTTEKLYKGE